MNPNQNPNGQQPYSNPQYTPLLNQQFTGAPQNGYAQATQQTNPGQSFNNYATTQSSYQTPMNAPVQQPAPYAQPQQQQSYQHYQQGSYAPVTSPAPQNQSWSQALPNTQWQTATNNTSTTTTTTTTTKSTKERYASQQDQGSLTATSDFTLLMQQAPPQQPPPQQSLQRQQTTNYTQVTQSGYQQQQQPPPPPPPPPPPQPAMNYSHLIQTVPQQSTTTTNFSQLMQTAPPPPPPQPQVSLAPPVVHTPVAPIILIPPKPAKAKKQDNQANQASGSAVTKKTTTTTTTKTKKVDGGSSRQKAADKSKVELKRFDQEVSEKLKRVYGGICPMGFDYYATRQGYICGGGSHFFEHDEVEAMLKHGRPPQPENVNYPFGLHDRQVTPPPGNGNGSGEEPLFWSQEQQVAHGYPPIKKSRQR